jgi:putative ABC transport system ATP-binding protein
LSTAAIEFDTVRFGYRPGQTVLDVPALRVDRGERVFLFGPSGSGKTTLLGLVTGVLTAREGRVGVLGQDLTPLSGARRDALRAAHLGYIFQMFNLIPYLSVLDNITLPCRISTERRARLGGRSMNDAARELANHLGIAAHINDPVTQLSVGQQQRVAACRALIGAPELIVADEPTSALDADRRSDFIELLFRSCEDVGATLLFVSHDRGLEPMFSRALSLPEINRVAEAPAGQTPAGEAPAVEA